MASRDPFEIVQPISAPPNDPFAIVQPSGRPPEPVARPELADPFEVVESTEDVADTLEPKEPGLLDRFVNWGAEKGRNLMDLQRAVTALGIGVGQAQQRSLQEDQGIIGKAQGIATEEAARIPSSVLEQLGTIYSDVTGTNEDNNLLYNAGRIIRDATKTPDDIAAEENLGSQFYRALTQTGAFFAGGATAKGLGLGTKASGGSCCLDGVSCWRAGRERRSYCSWS